MVINRHNSWINEEAIKISRILCNLRDIIQIELQFAEYYYFA